MLVVLTDTRPYAALERLTTRVGFVLMLASVLLIEYYPALGTYDARSYVGNCGVSTDKNMLGVIVFVLSVGAFWLVLRLLSDKSQPDRARHFLPRGTLWLSAYRFWSWPTPLPLRLASSLGPD